LAVAVNVRLRITRAMRFAGSPHSTNSRDWPGLPCSVRHTCDEFFY
jgi:hypothetical protein